MTGKVNVIRKSKVPEGNKSKDCLISNHVYIRRYYNCYSIYGCLCYQLYNNYNKALSLHSDTTALDVADSLKSANGNSATQSFKIHVDENGNKATSISKPLQEWKSLPNSNKAIKENSKVPSKWNQQMV